MHQSALIVAVGLMIGSANASAAVMQPLSDPHGNWILQPQYSDEFNGSSLDGQKWKTDVKSWGAWSWDDRNVSVAGGHLAIYMRYQIQSGAGHTRYYTSGIVQSTAPPVLYGYFEARIKGVSLFPGACPAFWAYKTTRDLWTEIDFVEIEQATVENNPRRIDLTAIAWRDPTLAHKIEIQKHFYPDWDPRENYHTYGFRWDKETLQWYVDGMLIESIPNRYWHQPLDIVLSLGLRSPLVSDPTPAGFPTEMQVDYIRVWKAPQ